MIKTLGILGIILIILGIIASITVFIVAVKIILYIFNEMKKDGDI